MYLITQIDANHHDSHDSEDGEHVLIDEREAKRHAVVLDEMNLEPVGNPDAFIEMHVGLHPNLDDLVDDH